MSKISELSDGGSLVSSDYLIAVRSGGNVKVRMDSINVDQVDLGDNEFIRLGNSQDLTMVHTSTQSIINQAGIGDLLLQKAGTTKASITANGLEFPDNSKAIFGAASDLQIYHDGFNSYIKDTGTGDLRIWADSPNISTASGNKIFFGNNGSAELYTSGGALRLATTASGIDVTGTVTADSLGIGGSPIAALDVTGTDAVGTLTSLADTVTRAAAIVRGSTHANGYGLYMGYGNASTDAQYIQSTLKTGAQAYPLLLNPYGGNVGIGTSSPSSYPVAPNLVVNAGTNGGITIKTGSTNYGGVYFADGTTGDEQYRGFIQYNHDYAGSTDSLLFGAAGTERLRIDANGKMLIGDTASHTSDLLQIETPASGGGHGIQIRRNDSNTDQGVGSITFGNNTATDLASISAKTDGATDNGALLFNTSVSGGANTERMRINSDGKIDVGGVANQTSAVLNARFNGAAIEFGHNNNNSGYYGTAGSYGNNGQPYIGFSCDAEQSANTFATRGFKGNIITGDLVGNLIFAQVTSANATGQVPEERMRISAAGQLFLNRTTEVAAGYIANIKCAAGTGGVLIQNSTTTGVPLSFRNTGGSGIGSVSTTNTATAYNTSSDQRLKDNIADADDAGSKVDSIQVRKFDWKADGSHQDYGMVAQELLEVAPEAVHQPQDPEEMMGVDYSKLVPMMLKEIQSLRARIAALES